MKAIFIILSFLVTSNSFADLSEKQVELLLEKIGKNIRRSYYIERHDNVSSAHSQLNRKEFESYLGENTNEEQPLDRSQISDIKNCFRNKNCSVHLFEVSSEYRGGAGVTNHWVLLDTVDGTYDEITNVVYSE